MYFSELSQEMRRKEKDREKKEKTQGERANKIIKKTNLTISSNKGEDN